MIGQIITWNTERGFGFLRATSGRNFFAHISKWIDDEAPAAGQTVVFDIAEGRKGLEAINIQIDSLQVGLDALKAGVR